MMNSKWMAAAAFGALALGGCASTDVGPREAELKANWEAQNIVPPNYKGDLMAFLRQYLNDPGKIRAAAGTQT